MTKVSMISFTDEFSKIALAGGLGKVMELLKSPAGKYIGAGSVGAGALHMGQKGKRRYDIGKAYEDQMEARQG